MSETGPFIWTLLFISIEIDNLPVENSISTLSFARPFCFAAKAVAQAAVPQAFVSPAPLSQTLTFINSLLTIVASVTLHFSGNSEWFSISGPIFLISKFSLLSTKKIICGFPTFTAVPPKNSFLLRSINLIFLFFWRIQYFLKVS